MIITILYFLLPAAVANMAAAVSAKLFPTLNFPLDFNLKFRQIRILGDHKTIRGFLFGVFCATLVYLLQIYLYKTNNYIHTISFINYEHLPVYFGTLLGLGAVSGDALKSFFKRQLGIQPGKSWIPFDQIDWAAGALIITSELITYKAGFIMVTLTLTFILHIVIKFIGFKLKLDQAAL